MDPRGAPAGKTLKVTSGSSIQTCSRVPKKLLKSMRRWPTPSKSVCGSMPQFLIAGPGLHWKSTRTASGRS
eukprot:4416393-Pyramimonas_sp.AAC.1